MLTYVQANTPQDDELFLKCGTKAVAGRIASAKSAGSGDNFSTVLNSNLQIIQPYDFTANSFNTANFLHQLTIVVPNYQTIQAMALNIMSFKQTIHSLVLNSVAVTSTGSGRELICQYQLHNGFITHYDCQPGAFGEGTITFGFVFEKIAYSDWATNTSGQMSTSGH